MKRFQDLTQEEKFYEINKTLTGLLESYEKDLQEEKESNGCLIDTFEDLIAKYTFIQDIVKEYMSKNTIKQERYCRDCSKCMKSVGAVGNLKTQRYEPYRHFTCTKTGKDTQEYNTCEFWEDYND